MYGLCLGLFTQKNHKKTELKADYQDVVRTKVKTVRFESEQGEWFFSICEFTQKQKLSNFLLWLGKKIFIAASLHTSK